MNNDNSQEGINQTPLDPRLASNDAVDLAHMHSYRKSRLRRTFDKQDKKQVFLFFAGIIILLVAVFRFGPPVIAFVSDFFISQKESSDSDNKKDSIESFVMPPILDNIPSATPSSSLIISGSHPDEKGKVEVYLNDELYKQTNLGKNGRFSITVRGLKEGENFIKAKFRNEEEKESEFTQDYSVIFSKKELMLEITSPSNDQEFKKGSEEISVQGKTDADSNVTVNGFRAVVEADGEFSYFYKLTDGDNIITIEAINQAGQSVKKELKVRYSP